jgi:hypothetical protein
MGIQFKKTSEEDIKALLQRKETLVISSINYEERSLTFLDKFLNNRPSAQFKILILRSLQDNIYILENVKDDNIKRAEEKFSRIQYNKDWKETINYPVGFSEETLKKSLEMFFENDCFNDVVLDITVIPRTVLFSIIKMFYELQIQNKIKTLYLVYTAPCKYSEYPYEIGTLETYSLRFPLYKLLDNIKSIKLLVVPSIYGIETKILIEELKKIPVKVEDFHLIIPFYNHDTFASKEILRNISNMIAYIKSVSDNFHYRFTFSFQHTMETILEVSNNSKISTDEAYLIAPFNAKPITISAFYACICLRKKGMSRTDVLRLSSFQYSSFYSIGIGDTFYWEVT